jgi:hypothetical protein
MSETEQQIQEESINNYKDEEQDQTEEEQLSEETKQTIEHAKPMNYPQLRELYLKLERLHNEFSIYTKKWLIIQMEEALESSGYPHKEIVEKVIKDLTAGGLTTEDYIRKVTPEKFKNPKKVSAGKQIMKEKTERQKLPDIMPELEQIEEEEEKGESIADGTYTEPVVMQYSENYVKGLQQKIENLENSLKNMKSVTVFKLDKTRANQLISATKNCKERVYLFLDSAGSCTKIKPDIDIENQ